MKLIFIVVVENFGVLGEIVEVKNGYGCNYLFLCGLVIVVICGVEKQIEGIKCVQEVCVICDLDYVCEVCN